MISVDEALERVLAAARDHGPLPAERVTLAEASRRVIRESVTADRDMPPFTRSAMDGYALRADDVARVPATLDVVEEIPAGSGPGRRVGPGQASRIMTGAAMPEGADAVQMVEKTRCRDDDRVVIEEPVPAGRHVRYAGEEMRAGDELVPMGARLDAAKTALLASAGRETVSVTRRPRVAIIPTGDELVPVGAEPGTAQIRESNGQTLHALVLRAGAEAHLYPIVRDTLEDLKQTIARALDDADVVLLSGGVSMGDYDLVGEALTSLGYTSIIERVAIQPGKPLWFGRTKEEESPLVFGLPGNPVSTVVDFLLFVRPALRVLSGHRDVTDTVVPGHLAEPVTRRPGRRGYLPATVTPRDGRLEVRLVQSKGSADMVALSRADALVVLPEDVATFESGFTVDLLMLEGLL